MLPIHVWFLLFSGRIRPTDKRCRVFQVIIQTDSNPVIHTERANPANLRSNRLTDPVRRNYLHLASEEILVLPVFNTGNSVCMYQNRAVIDQKERFSQSLRDHSQSLSAASVTVAPEHYVSIIMAEKPFPSRQAFAYQTSCFYPYSLIRDIRYIYIYSILCSILSCMAP